MHTMDTDIRSGIIGITISGFCTDDELERFMTDLDAAVATIRATGREHMILGDYTHAAIQSQRTIAALQARIVETEHKARRVALFTCGQLARMQAKRVASVRDTIGVFGDRDSALAWLLSDDQEDQPIARTATG